MFSNAVPSVALSFRDIQNVVYFKDACFSDTHVFLFNETIFFCINELYSAYIIIHGFNKRITEFYVA